jgi:hypothetical protein
MEWAINPGMTIHIKDTTRAIQTVSIKFNGNTIYYPSILIPTPYYNNHCAR